MILRGMLIAGFLTCANTLLHGQDSTALKEIDEYLSAQMIKAGIPGAALAIVKGNQVIHLKGFGMREPSG